MPHQEQAIPLFIDFSQEQLSELESQVLAVLIHQKLPPPIDLEIYDGPVKLSKQNRDNQDQKIPHLIEIDQQRYAVTLSNSLMMRLSDKDKQNPVRYEVLPNKNEQTQSNNPQLVGKGAFGKVVWVLKKIKLFAHSIQLKNHRLPRAMKIIAINSVNISSDQQIPQLLRNIGEMVNENELLKHIYHGVKNLSVHFSQQKTALKFYFLMPLFQGKSLQNWLNEWSYAPGKKSLLDRLRIMYLIAKMVTEVHQRQIIHRDLKPDNIVYDDTSQQLHIADFGLAAFIDAPEEWLRCRLGTAEYIAMETALRQPATYAVDIFAEGGIFAQLLSKEPESVVRERTRKKLDSFTTDIALMKGYPNYNLANVLQDDELMSQCAAGQQQQLLEFVGRMVDVNYRKRPSNTEVLQFIEQQIQILAPAQTEIFKTPNDGQKHIELQPIKNSLEKPDTEKVESLLSPRAIKIGLISLALVLFGLLTIVFAPPTAFLGIAGILVYAGIAITSLGILGFLGTIYEIFHERPTSEVVQSKEPVNPLAQFYPILGFKLASEQFITENQFDQSSSFDFKFRPSSQQPAPSQNVAKISLEL